MNETETKTCVSCQADFSIAPEDFSFYQKMEVPPPTWCPRCRIQRRFSFNNERRVFNRSDARDGTMIFSGFSPDSPIKTYHNDFWYGDGWEPLDFGRDYDFSKPFFQQFKELLAEVPLLARTTNNCENSEYCVMAGWLKNCYLVSYADYSQDSAYLVFDAHSRNCFDCGQTEQCELCYGSVNLKQCYAVNYSVNCQNSRELVLCKDMIGCSNCFGCVNLRNKQYYIFNREYTKEDYEAKLNELGINSYANLEKLKQQAYDFWLQYPNKFIEGSNNQNVSGEYISNSKNVLDCYRIYGGEELKYTQNINLKQCKETMDYTGWGNGAELMYEDVVCGENVYNLKFCYCSWQNNRDLQYTYYCMNSKDLFGCIGLRKKQFCILNKQYTEQEYNELVPKVIQHMKEMPYIDSLGREYRYGEFFPTELSPVEYNITIAQGYFSLTKEEALAQGYSWYDQPERRSEIELQSEELPDTVGEKTIQLAGKIIQCQHNGECTDGCSVAFTIIPQEMAFLFQQGLPLPRLCPSCRAADRMKFRRSFELHQRQCDCQGANSKQRAHQYTNASSEHAPYGSNEPCPNSFETSFAEGDDIVYCAECYEKELI